MPFGNEMDSQADSIDILSIAAGDNTIGRFKITDGTDVADVIDSGTYAGLGAYILDGSGDPITSFGGGTQYTEGDTDASITGVAMMWEDGSDTLRAVSSSKPLPVDSLAIHTDNVAFSGGDKGVATLAVYNTDTITNGLGLHTTGDYVPLSVDASANLRVALYSGNVELDSSPSGSDGNSNSRKAYYSYSRPSFFNGTTWDRFRGDATDGLLVNLGSNNDVTLATLPDTAAGDLAAQTTDLAAIEVLLGTIDADTGTIAGAVSGGQMQVDIVADGAGLLTSANFAAAFGTAGSADSQVMSVQGIASMTPLLVDATGQGDVPITLGGEVVTVDLGANNDVTVTSGAITETNSAAIKTAVETIDNAISGSEMQVDVVASLPAGTNAIGKLAANSGVDIGDVDVTSLPNAAGDTNYFSATITSADASTATQVVAKTAAKKIYVTSLMISVGSSALEVKLQSDNGTPQVVMREVFLAANGGLAWSAADKTLPLFVVNTNEDLDVITSGSGDVTVSVSGYIV